MDAFPQLRQHVAIGAAGDHDAVGLGYAVARMREPIGQVAVVGRQDQAVAVQIEPPDRKQPHVLRRQQVNDSGPARGVTVGAQNANRLMDGEVDKLRPPQRHAVDANLLLIWIRSRAQFDDYAAIDLHPAGCDQLFALPPAADSGGGKHLL